MNTYSFSAEAIQDLESICQYISQSNDLAASKTFDAIRKKAKLLAQFPSMGKAYDQLAPNLRGAPVEDYLIFYYPRPDGIDIVRIISGYRDLEQLF
ncbi:type II toxin-antitoxin system RelE/ParE family toxin [Alkalinema pantanalense CENA528]|uniref:type II toxin-antitoxin system RelE/ParE family toxin n=1 Tax=Alkalinema pantanalense TaxID=1620705 RepID=UPI003D6F3313